MKVTMNVLKERYDVVIVGAGPAGAGTAKALTGSGLRTVVIERAPLPRDKVCTGILFPSAVKIISDYFGELPERVFCKRREVKANRMYITNDSKVAESPWAAMDPGEGLPPYGFNVHRAELDFWLCQQSDASLVDHCLFVDYRLNGDNILVKVKHNEKYREIRTKFLVGADGMRSRVRRSISPELEKSIVWYPVYEEWYKGSIDLERGFMYFFLDSSITDFFATVFDKDERIFVTTTVKQGKSSKKYLWRFRDFLKEKHGLKVERTIGTRGTIKNDMTGRKNYVFGWGNILIAGEANGIMEGINVAMNTGRAAGGAIRDSLKMKKPAYECFIENKLLISERDRGEMIQAGLVAHLGFNMYRR